MLMTFTLPNGKKVAVKEFLYKHIRGLQLQGDCISSKLKYIEDFIITQNLNVIEQFITLLLLRKKCIKPTTALYIDDADKEVHIDYILESFEDNISIKEKVNSGSIQLTLDYPSKFCINTTHLLSVIREIKIEDQRIIVDSLPEHEFLQVIDKLPAEILNVVDNFVTNNQKAFVFPLLSGRSNLYDINFLDPSPFVFIDTLFSCIDENSYREYLFILSKRIGDVEFIINSPFVDILDYLELYKRECEEENKKLKN
jgi:hypothetical protein